jgi:hypothetical protein
MKYLRTKGKKVSGLIYQAVMLKILEEEYLCKN